MNNLDKAIKGLDRFMKNYCMDREKTKENEEPTFRCLMCMFRDGDSCLIKQFVAAKGEIPNGFGAMSR